MYSREERKALLLAFWTSFDLYCKHQGYLAGRKKQWILHRTKVSHVHLKFLLEKESVGVGIEVSHRDEDSRIEMYEKLVACKMLLEDGFEDGLEWNFVTEKEFGHEVCSISTFLLGVCFLKQADWLTIFEFYAKNMFRLENNFLEIRDIITS